MKIKRKVERAVRKALAGAVAGETDRFDSAVTAINLAGEDFSNKALDLIFAIGAETLSSIHHGDRPDNKQLRILTQDFVDYEEWSGIDAETTIAYLTALADGDSPREVLPIQDAVFAACAVGGWLLSAFIPDDVEWTDFLDGILARLEATPVLSAEQS